jgi:predicted secreted protein
MKKWMMMIALTSLSFAPGLWAEMYTNLDIIGFSSDGRYLAYEVNGYSTATKKAFSLIQIVDVVKNDFVGDEFLAEAENGNNKLENRTLRDSAYRRAATTIQRYKIVEGNEGTLIYEQYRIAAVHEVSFTINPGAAEVQQYRLVLSPRTVESSRCSHLTNEGRTPKIFTLALQREQRNKVLQKDSILYRSRNCPYDYGIYRIYVFEDKLAVFLHSFTSRADVYKLVVTGTLDFPDITMRAVLESPTQIAEYRYKGDETFLDSGRLSVQLVSDSSTYDRERNSDSYRKLVIIDKRQDEPVIRAFVLPPGVYFDYPYYIHDIHDAEKKLVLLTGKNCFYIYDVLQNGLSSAVYPARDKPGIGVDGRSGNLVRCKISHDGTILTGAVVHSGNFVYDMSDPLAPKEVEYRVDYNTND